MSILVKEFHPEGGLLFEANLDLNAELATQLKKLLKSFGRMVFGWKFFSKEGYIIPTTPVWKIGMKDGDKLIAVH